MEALVQLDLGSPGRAAELAKEIAAHTLEGRDLAFMALNYPDLMCSLGGMPGEDGNQGSLRRFRGQDMLQLMRGRKARAYAGQSIRPLKAEGRRFLTERGSSKGGKQKNRPVLQLARPRLFKGRPTGILSDTQAVGALEFCRCADICVVVLVVSIMKLTASWRFMHSWVVFATHCAELCNLIEDALIDEMLQFDLGVRLNRCKDRNAGLRAANDVGIHTVRALQCCYDVCRAPLSHSYQSSHRRSS